MLFKLCRYLVDVVLGLVVLGFERGYALALLFEEAEEALLFALVKVQTLELNDEVRQLLADLAHVLGAHLAQRGTGEIGDVLLRGGAVVEYLLAVRDVYLPGKVAHCGLLGGGEPLKLQLLRRDLLLSGGYRLSRGLLNRQIGGGLGRRRVGVESQ